MRPQNLKGEIDDSVSYGSGSFLEMAREALGLEERVEGKREAPEEGLSEKIERSPFSASPVKSEGLTFFSLKAK